MPKNLTKHSVAILYSASTNSTRSETSCKSQQKSNLNSLKPRTNSHALNTYQTDAVSLDKDMAPADCAFERGTIVQDSVLS